MSLINKRIVIIDSLRGFALFGILLSHMLGQYYANTLPPGYYHQTETGFDGLYAHFAGYFIGGKFFTIFSMLFGLSFYLQMEQAENKGIDFRYRFLWRLILLFFIGYVHNLLYSGDILIIYSISGVVLIIFYKVKSKYLLILAIIILSGFPKFIIYELTSKPSTETIIDVQDRTEYYNALKKGTLKDVIKVNAISSLKPKFYNLYVMTDRGYQTVALFIIGLLLGRWKIFKNIENYLEQIKKGIMYFGSISIFLFFDIFLLYKLGYKGDIDSFMGLVITTINSYFNLMFTGILICLFIFLYLKLKQKSIFIDLATVGKMGLSNYVIQSIISTTIFYNFGFGLLFKLNTWQCHLIGIMIFILQILVSKMWIKKFNYGPLEWLWRSGTYLKIQPLYRYGNT